MKRLFVAIQLDEKSREALGAYRDNRERAMPSVRWMPAGNLHVTVLFLGDTKEEEIPRISGELSAIAGGTPKFTMTFGAPVYAPPHPLRRETSRPPTMVWMTVGETGEFTRLAKGIIGALGTPHDLKKISPHITLARFREGAVTSDPSKLGRTGLEGKGLAVDAITLMESRLTPSGAVYAQLGEFRFNTL